MIGHTAPYNKTTHFPVQLCWGGSVMKKASGGLAQDASRVAGAGQGNDSMIIHVSPNEYHSLVKMFGEPSRNPHTGMPAFFGLDDIIGGIGDFVSGIFGGGGSDAASVASDAASTASDATSAVPTMEMGMAADRASMPGYGGPQDYITAASIPGGTPAASSSSGGLGGGLHGVLNALGLGGGKNGKGMSTGLTDLLKLGLIGQTIYGMVNGPNRGDAPAAQVNNSNLTAHLTPATMNRTFNGPSNVNFARYGMGLSISFISTMA